VKLPISSRLWPVCDVALSRGGSAESGEEIAVAAEENYLRFEPW